MGNAQVRGGSSYSLRRCFPNDPCLSNVINRSQSFEGAVRLRLLARSVGPEPTGGATMVSIYLDEWLYALYTVGSASGAFGLLQVS